LRFLQGDDVLGYQTRLAIDWRDLIDGEDSVCGVPIGIEGGTPGDAHIRGLQLGGTATRKRNVAILGYRREKRSFFIRNNLFRNRKSRTMASAKLADQKGPEQMRAETGKLRSLFNLPKTPKIDG